MRRTNGARSTSYVDISFLSCFPRSLLTLFHLLAGARSLLFQTEVSARFVLCGAQDSLEDELSTCNESVVTEPSFVDENLVFNESKRVPFFKVSSTNISSDVLLQWKRLQ